MAQHQEVVFKPKQEDGLWPIKNAVDPGNLPPTETPSNLVLVFGFFFSFLPLCYVSFFFFVILQLNLTRFPFYRFIAVRRQSASVHRQLRRSFSTKITQ